MKTRLEREFELTGKLLEGRKNLYTAYAIAMGAHPPEGVPDRDLIQRILDKEFGTPHKQPENQND
jgi:hypothetical protein